MISKRLGLGVRVVKGKVRGKILYLLYTVSTVGCRLQMTQTTGLFLSVQIFLGKTVNCK